jgi:NAD(P)-dependent dehydrogenase (short-subunit alcohol dehydrogenase family)
MPTAVVTGANRGIGLELCRQLIARDHRVYGLCRRSSEALAEAGAEVIDGLDLGSPDTIDSVAERLAGLDIDLLINNAGILLRHDLASLEAADLHRQFEINAVGPLLLTRALLPGLRRGSKVGLVTSRMGSIGDNTSGGAYGYRMSKAALNIAGVSLARDLEPRGVAVVLLHPGWVRTGMTGGTGDVEAAEAARGLLARIDEVDLESSGRFVHAKGQPLPW